MKPEIRTAIAEERQQAALRLALGLGHSYADAVRIGEAAKQEAEFGLKWDGRTSPGGLTSVGRAPDGTLSMDVVSSSGKHFDPLGKGMAAARTDD